MTAFRSALVIAIAIAIGFSGDTVYSQNAEPRAPSAIESLVQLTKSVIRSAAEFGFEEAGTRLLGSNWKYAKAVIEPVYKEFERRYPALTLLDTREAEAAALRAAESLDTDATLRALLQSQFNRLETGQGQILLELARIQNQLDENKQLTLEVLQRLPRNSATFRPNPPSQLTVQCIKGKGYVLKWSDNSTNELGFNIYRWSDAEQIKVRTHNLRRTVSANVVEYVDEDSWQCSSPFVVSYQVASYNETGESERIQWEIRPALPTETTR